ncbi:MAG TPA: NAD(P)H-hydrate dehydratase [Gemmatimonadaceae bacterium]|nr:NAD(P)H-hydrate dehydratase [Gemmatimonadaceae bacterium]
MQVTTAAESAALDAYTIRQGTPAAVLMRRAGEAAASAIERSHGDRLSEGVYVAVGPGNNGGDGWIVAALLARGGFPVRVCEVVPARSDDARAARDAAIHSVTLGDSWSGEGVVVDALLGTGSSGEPRDAIAVAVADMTRARKSGAVVAALDVPTGLDATSGDARQSVVADLTITFGSVKRGLLASRDRCGRIVVADIGLQVSPDADLPSLVTASEAYAIVPPIPTGAHKGSRGGVSILGGGPGMAGAAALAAQGALRSGAGSSRICVSDENVLVAHTVVPAALVTPWSRVLADVPKYLGSWPEAIAVGPGFGTDGQAPELLDRLLATWAGPLVIDADALNLFAGRVDELRERLAAKGAGVRAVLTPHAAEMKRLLGAESAQRLLDDKYDVALDLARRTGAVVLFKGVPTVIAAPDGTRRVTATGTAALATGGSGDVLSGIIATLLAQGVPAFDAAAAGAWMHGRAAELATGDRTPRGITIEDVVERLRDVWVPPGSELPPGVLAELPPVT